MIFLLCTIAFVTGRVTKFRGSSGCVDHHPDCKECDADSCYDDSWVQDNCPCLCHPSSDDSSSSSDEEPCDACEGGRFPSAHVSVDVDVGYHKNRGGYHHGSSSTHHHHSHHTDDGDHGRGGDFHHHHGCEDAGGVDLHASCLHHDPLHCSEETEHGEWLRDHCPCLCPPPTHAPTLVPTSSPTWLPTVMPTPSPSPMPTIVPTPSPSMLPTTLPTGAPSASPTAPMGPVEVDQGCANAGELTIHPKGEFPVNDMEECTDECIATPECKAAHFTDGWLPWAATQQTSGGYTVAVGHATVQELLKTTCKIASCDVRTATDLDLHDVDCVNAVCSPPGQDGCPDDEECVSVGPSTANCGNTIISHTAEECSTDGVNAATNDVTPKNELDSSGTQALFLDTATNLIGAVSTPNCAGDTHANSCFGPYQDSDPFTAFVGDELSWSYQAEWLGISGSSTGDWFEVMVIIYRDGVPVKIPTYRFGDKLDDPRTDYYSVEQEGEHTIRFIVGSYDASGATILGATMTVHKFERFDANGDGYSMCRLLTDGCNQVAIDGAEVSHKDEDTTDTPAFVPLARRLAQRTPLVMRLGLF